MPINTDPINNVAAYGSVPVIPPFSTNRTQSTSTSTPNLPNYDALASAASLTAGNQMAGQLNPQDLANAQTWAAQRGVATGTGFGSPNNMAAYQQFLGLSAQQLEQQGMTNYNALLAGAPKTTTSDVATTIDNNVLAAENAAAPSPYAAAMANLAAQRAGMGAGGAAGGGGGTGHPNTAAAGGTGNAGGGGGGGSPVNEYSLGEGSFATFGNMGQSWEDLFSDQSSGSGAGGGIDQTVYNPGTDQSQYNYGIPDYYGTFGADAGAGGGGGFDYSGETFWDNLDGG